MTIIKDAQKTLNIANDISNILLNDMLKACQEHIPGLEDDPADMFYIMAHTLGGFIFKAKKTMSEYAKIYGIEKMDYQKFHEWVQSIEESYINNYPKEYTA